MFVGLDPAGMFFASAKLPVRLDSSDAKFVDAIHSDAETPYLGTTNQQAHADFYPNGALLQPGCKKLPVGKLKTPFDESKVDTLTIPYYITNTP